MERLTEKELEDGWIVYNRTKYTHETTRFISSPIREIIKKLKEYEDLEEQGKLLKLPCAVGDTVYYRYDGIKIAPMRVEQIIIAQYGINLLLEYCGNDEQLKYWRINIESTAFDNKIIFLTREEAEAALKQL